MYHLEQIKNRKIKMINKNKIQKLKWKIIKTLEL